MKIVAITGGIGSGKTEVCKFLGDLGVAVINTDDIAQRLLMTIDVYLKIVEVFGQRVLTSEMKIDKRALSRIVFNDPEMLLALNSITHEYIYMELKKILKRLEGEEVVVVEIPLLFQVSVSLDIQFSIAILSDTQLRIQRVMERSGRSEQEIMSIIKCQLPDRVYLEKADFVIYNNSEFDKTKADVYKVYQQIVQG